MGFLAKFWLFVTTGVMPKVMEWLGVAGAVIGAWAMIKKSGETAIELKEEANTLKAVKVRDEVENNVSKLSDDAVTKQLRDRGELRD